MKPKTNEHPEAPAGAFYPAALSKTDPRMALLRVHRTSNEVEVEPTQSSLFPLDPWGTEQVFAVVDQPHPGILRAMIGPLTIGEAYQPSTGEIRCLAVSEDRHFASSMMIAAPLINERNELWCRVASSLKTAQHEALQLSEDVAALTPKDCLLAWSTPSFWMQIMQHLDQVHASVHALSKLMTRREYGINDGFHNDENRLQMERAAKIAVEDQVSAGVIQLLSALHSGLFEVLCGRRRLSISVACRILHLASRHGVNAEKYALQALRTESFGVLNMVSSGQPEVEAAQIRHAIFSGESLPSVFEMLGVAKAVHRQTVVKPIRNDRQVQQNAEGIHDLSISGREWLIAMRLYKYIPLHDAADWAEFGYLMHRLKSLNLLSAPFTPKLLQWCATPSYTDGRSRLDQLISVAKHLKSSTNDGAGEDITFDVALALALSLTDAMKDYFGPHYIEAIVNPANASHLIDLLAEMSGQTTGQLLRQITKSQPEIPPFFREQTNMIVYPIDSLEAGEAHGKKCANCLKVPERLAQYWVEGHALYGVRLGSEVVGTIALRYDGTEVNPKVEVQEATGVGNAIAPFDLCRLAQSLADSWTPQAQLLEWATYESKCAEFRKFILRRVAQLLLVKMRLD